MMQYGCIGEKLSHSFSVEIHRLLGQYPYVLKELAEDDVGAFLKTRDFLGINVTIPYKRTVLPYLDEIDADAVRIGAVNTVVNRGGKLYGYNTDAFGMTQALAFAGIDLCGKNAAILGTGGTSKTACRVAEALGAARVVRVSRAPREAGVISYGELYRTRDAWQILLNTTPVGMYPNDGPMPVDPADYPALCGVFDAVYHPLRTSFVLSARALGIPACGGLYMLVAQAARAASLFFGDDSMQTRRRIDGVYHAMVGAKENIVLIGMPGCGKTSVGRVLANDLGRPFFDADAVLEARVGTSIPTYFENHTEAEFRALETAVLRDLCKETGAVLATGGGAVTVPENVDLLRRNGKIVFLDRPLDALEGTAGRPLTPDRTALAQKYTERLPLYRAAADRTVSVTGDVNAAAAALQQLLSAR